jgi:hypothetical protein
MKPENMIFSHPHWYQLLERVKLALSSDDFVLPPIHPGRVASPYQHLRETDLMSVGVKHGNRALTTHHNCGIFVMLSDFFVRRLKIHDNCLVWSRHFGVYCQLARHYIYFRQNFPNSFL